MVDVSRTSDPPEAEDVAPTQDWDGATLRSTCNDWVLVARDRLADAARDGLWTQVFDVLQEHPQFANTSRPGGASLFTPLHQAAHHGASADVIEGLLRVRAWRTARNARGERPVDTARRKGNTSSVALLEPEAVAPIPITALAGVQAHFHDVIRGRAAEQVREHQLRLPELEPMTEFPLRQRFWFAVPGMYGGFVYWLEQAGDDARLVTESWCRVAGGSGQRHAVTATGQEMVAEGFV